MKKFLPLLVCLLLPGLLCGCVRISDLLDRPGSEDASVSVSEPMSEPTAEPTPAPTPVPVYGVWQYEGLEQYLVFAEDGTWQLYTDAGLYREGLLTVSDDESEAWLYLMDGSLFPGDDNAIRFSGSTGTDWDGDSLLPSALPDFPASQADEMGLTGIWKYDDYPVWIVICPGGGWTQYTTDYENYNVTYGSVLYRDPPVLFNTWGKFDMTLTLASPEASSAIDADGNILSRVDALPFRNFYPTD